MKKFFRRGIVLFSALAVLMAMLVAPASARETTLSATATSTWQTNYIVRKLAYANGKLFVGGEFTSVRPPGAAPGTGEVARSYLAIFDSTTGNLLSAAPNPDGAVWAMTASADGKTVYVGGDFTHIGGVARSRIAAIDTTTLAISSTFKPTVSYRVAAIDVNGSNVYLGGSFGVVSGQPRIRAAAVSASNGTLLPWDPNADNDVSTIKVAPDGSKVYLGGKFANIGGQPHGSVALVDSALGTPMAFPAASAVPDRTSGCWSKVEDIISDQDTVYFANAGDGGGCFDGTWAASISTGQLVWRNSCLGATEALAIVGGWLYKGSHAHDCSSAGGFPQGANHFLLAENMSTGEVMGWYPQTNAGPATYVGPWAMATDGTNLWVGGDFTQVNGVGQQGLTAFGAGMTTAPTRPLTPTASSSRAGQAKVVFKSTLDKDDETLTYKLYRNNDSVPISTQQIRSRFWDQPSVSYIDTGLAPGSQVAYRVEASDGTNIVTSYWTPYLTVATKDADYPTTVAADGASYFWKLNEQSGSTTAADTLGGNTLSLSNVTTGQPGLLAGSNAAYLATASSKMTSSISTVGPQAFTAEMWVKTTTNQGGRIVGFGDQQTGQSGSYDRQVYLGNDGHVNFGVYPGSTVVVHSSVPVNDGNWHQIVATMTPGHSELFVDGVSQGTAAPANAQAYSGYWRIGADNLNGWPDQPSNAGMVGTIANVAVYPVPLSASDVSWHYGLAFGGGAPLAKFTKSCTDLSCTFDGSASNVNGTVASYAWSFGDGTTATGANPSHAYAANGTYTVTLTTAGTIGGAATATDQVTVLGPNQLPVATFKSYCTALACTFDGTPSNDPDGLISSYAWDFGDQAVGSGQSPAHNYSTAGTYPVKLTVTDDRGGTSTQTASLVLPKDNSYAATVKADGAAPQWRLEEQSGSTISDSSGNNTGTATNVTLAQPGILAGTYSGELNGVDSKITSSVPVTNPQTFSLETWIKTTTTSGGRILGFGNSATGQSGNYDRQLYMRNDGHVNFGIWTGTASLVTSTSALNDGTWHHIVATNGDGVQKLYVDGVSQGATAAGTPQPYDGFWRVGADNLNSWPDQPSAAVISGNIDEVAVYPILLSAKDVSWHYELGLDNSAPTALFTSKCVDLSCTFDGSASTDTDGSVVSYSWDFGDGTTASGSTAQHTFASGAHDVKLVVTDNRGATGNVSHTVTVQAANILPVAAFTVNCTALSCAFDGTGSSDPDGTVSTWNWDFGDGQTATGSQPTNVYAAYNSYPVKLTVTDNSGGQSTVTQPVVLQAANQSPNAAFTVSCSNLQCSVDASTSTDPDGSVSSYAWDFGDSQTGTGVTAQHVFGANGTYPVKLTVTDNRGGQDSVTKQVTVALSQPAGTVLAKDDFGRTLAKGLGISDVGGPWTVAGSTTRYSVTPGSGQWIMLSPGNAPSASLGSVVATDSDTSLNLNLDKVASGGGIYFALSGRSIPGAGDYRAKVRYVAAGTIYLAIVRTSSTGVETYLTPETLVTGLKPAPGNDVSLRLQVTGQGTTTIKTKIWLASAPEPTAWLQSTSDTTSGLQAAGSVGISAQLSGSATNAPVTAHVS